mgnify:CR=1 FL=1
MGVRLPGRRFRQDLRRRVRRDEDADEFQARGVGADMGPREHVAEEKPLGAVTLNDDEHDAAIAAVNSTVVRCGPDTASFRMLTITLTVATLDATADSATVAKLAIST